MLIECANCGFYLNPTERFCPDCGLNDPQTPLEPSEQKIESYALPKIAGIVGAAALLGFTLYRLNGDDFGDWFRLAMIVLLFGTAISILAVMLKARRSVSTLNRERFSNAENGASLQYIYDTCLFRNHELSEMRRGFRSSVKRGVRLSDPKIETEQRQPKNEIPVLLARYEMFLQWISLTRLQNRLLSLARRQNALNAADFSDELDELSQEIENISAESDQDFGEISESFADEKENFRAATEKTEKLCAVLAARRKDAKRFDAPFPEESGNQSEIADARRNLQEIARLFAALEREYRRLQI